MSFVIDEIVSSREALSWRTFPLPQAAELKANIARIFSQHLGDLRQDISFESQCLIVTAEPGSGKTKEVKHQIAQFNDAGILLPDGKPAKIVSCLLDAKGGWKDLGSTTLRSLAYPIENLARHTQASITAKIVDHPSAVASSAFISTKRSTSFAARMSRTGTSFSTPSRP